MVERMAKQRKGGGPGRPRGDGRGEEVRAALLSAARNYFSTRGFQQASLREIASEAGVNPAMIHYYFGNKQGLYIAMLSEAVAPLIERLEGLNEQAAGRDGLRTFLRHYARTLLEEPWFPNLLVREVLFQQGEVRKDFIARFASRASGALRGLIGHDLEAGRLPPYIDPAFGSLGILSLTLFPFIAQPAVEQVFDQRIDEAFVERLTDHTVALFYGAAADSDVKGDRQCAHE